MEWLSLIILFVLGIMMLFKPELLWNTEYFFTVKNGEPSDLYLALMRIGGVFFILASIICGVVYIWKM